MTSTALEVTEKVFSLLQEHGTDSYLGEPVTQLEHAIQCAMAAERHGRPPEVVLGALLHDIGHLAGREGNRMKTDGTILGVEDHDKVGEQFLRQLGVPDSITDFVSGHVQAKRYLTFTDPAYYNNLSTASRMTLAHQGGPMTSSEAADFEKNARFRDMLSVRTWDEEAKVKDMSITPLTWYRDMFKSYMTQVLN